MFETFFQNSTKQALTTYDQIVNQINALEKDFNVILTSAYGCHIPKRLKTQHTLWRE